MGITTSSKKKSGDPESTATMSSPLSKRLTSQQLRMVQETYAMMQEANIKKIALNMFINMFRERPDLMKIFRFYRGQKVEDLHKDAHLQHHANNVLMSMGNAVYAASQDQGMLRRWSILGNRHGLNNVKPEYWPLMGAALKKTQLESLGDKFTSEHQSSWDLFFTILSAHMISGIR